MFDFNQRLFHGTNTSFSHFSLLKCGGGTKKPLGFLGLYFTPCPKLASDFTKNKWDSKRSVYKKGANVIPVKVSPMKVKYWNVMDWLPHSGSTPESIEAIRSSLKSEGYDCIVVQRDTTHCPDELYVEQIIVLDANIVHFDIISSPTVSAFG